MQEYVNSGRQYFLAACFGMQLSTGENLCLDATDATIQQPVFVNRQCLEHSE
jgi:hypothetical protein